MEFVVGQAKHMLFLETSGNQINGSHIGRLTRGDLKGLIDGESVRFTSSLPMEGTHLNYAFSGKVTGDSMSGDVNMGEHGIGRWTAERHTGMRRSRA